MVGELASVHMPGKHSEFLRTDWSLFSGPEHTQQEARELNGHLRWERHSTMNVKMMELRRVAAKAAGQACSIFT